MINQTLAIKEKEEKTLMLTSDGEIQSVEFVRQIALRLKMTYKKPKNCKPEDIMADDDFNIIAEKALAQGYDPLGEGFHYWKFRGKLDFMGHYATWVAWAQKVEPFVFDFETEETDSGWKTTAIITKRKDAQVYDRIFQNTLTTLLGAEVEKMEAITLSRAEARRTCASARTGEVERSEVYNKEGNLIYDRTPKGWTPGKTRSEIRAMRNVIKAAYGQPPAGEMRRMVLGSFGASNAQMQIMAETPLELMKESPEIRERHFQLEAQAQQISAESRERTSEENRERNLKNISLMRGPDAIEEDIIDIAAKEVEQVDPRSWSNKFADYGITTIKELDNISSWLFGVGFEYLEDVSRQSTLAFVQRAAILNQNKTPDEKPIPIATRVNYIPELTGQKLSIKEAKEALRRQISKLTTENSFMPLLGETDE